MKNKNVELYSQDRIDDAVYNELIGIHCNFKYREDFVLPLLRQQKLCDIYPALLTRFKYQAEDSIIIGLSKLIDNSNDSHQIHFKRFIISAKTIEIGKLKNPHVWQDFNREADCFLLDLDNLKRKLDPLRNQFRVHLSPIKVVSEEDRTTWTFWLEILERMEKIYNLYQAATKGASTHQFYVLELEHEPENFLKWCRLDKFEEHRNKEMEFFLSKPRKQRTTPELSGEV